jgi:small-conductance mechanosensitive channel
MIHRTRSRRAWLAPAIALTLAIVLGARPAPAQKLPLGEAAAPATPAAPPEPETAESLEARRAEVTQEIETLRAVADTASEGEQARRLARIDLLERIDRALARRAANLRTLAELDQEPEASTDLLGASPPYPLALLDAVSASLDAHRTEQVAAEERHERARREVEQRLAEVDDRERARREARTAVESAKDAVEKAEREEALRQAQLESRLAQERLALARSEVELADRELAARERSAAIVEATRDRIRENLALTRFDLDEPLQRIALEEEATRRVLERAQAELASEDRHLEAVRKRVEEARPEPSPTLREELEAARARRQAAQWQVAVHDERIRQIGVLRDTWQRRWQALAGRADESTVLEWQRELEGRVDELRRQLRVAETRSSDLARDLEALRSGPTADADPELARWRAARIEALERLDTLYDQGRDQVAEQNRELGRALSDLRSITDTEEPGAGARELLTRAREVLGRELIVVDDRSISLGKLLGALLLFVMGFSLSRALARITGRLVYSRLSAPGAAYAFERLTFYGLVVVFFLVALRLVAIPLTAFALLGGALAIGLGFGSQNVINNFISGLIVLVERPMKVGDIVDVDGVSGIVERVGPRSTRVRTFDNLHIIVPNSSFLERNVVNWTLSDLTIRRNVSVGVAYGSDARETSRLIRRALDEHGRVLKTPAPQVFFWEFGDNALVFRAYFWLQLQPNTSFFETESDVRHRIYNLLAEAGITIAFPQRDVHLDTLRPLDVRMVRDDEPPSDA